MPCSQFGVHRNLLNLAYTFVIRATANEGRSVKPMTNLDSLLLLEFLVDANVVLAGAAFFYWSKPIAASINAWTVKSYGGSPSSRCCPVPEMLEQAEL